MVGLRRDGRRSREAERPSDGSRSSNWQSMRLLVAGHERSIGGLAITSALSGLAEAGILAIVAQVAASLLSGADSVHIGLGPVDLDPTIGVLLGLAGLLAVARVALQALSSYSQARLAADVQADLRKNLFAAFSRASWALQSTDRESHLQELVTTQAMQSTGGALQLAGLVSSFLTFLILLASAMVLNVVAAAVVVAVAAVFFVMLRPLSALGRRSATELSRAQLDFAAGIGEAVRMAEETHVIGVGTAQRERIAALADSSRHLFFRTQFVSRLVPALFQSLIYLTVVAGLGVLYATNATAVASLGAVILMMVRAGSYGQQVQSSYQAVLQSLPFVERIYAAVGRYQAQAVPPGRAHLERLERLSFERVSYAYRSDEPVLREISFSAGRGEAIGVVGPSGAGKSTLVQLLLRLREPSEGRYAINGVDAGEFAAADWHRRVAYVPQKPQLLHATVTENIRYYRDVDDGTVERAARLARIDDDIRGWRDGYETVIGPRADSISGGQQQRICLARALASLPEVLVLDEPTSALDPRSEALIQESLAEIAASLTLFVVTHRMSMLAVCDSVLVIVDGQLDDFGEASALRQSNRYLSAV